MAEQFKLYSNYGTESNPKKYDRFSPEHAEEIRKGIEHSIPDDVLRMSRAFPTFKIFFIEEDAPNWGLDDDVYGYSSVIGIDIYKSRKNAGDIATVELTNFEGRLDSKKFKARDHADSIKETADARAKKEQATIDKMMLRPGTRIQIKLGYSPKSKDLQNVFTGKITAVEYGDIVKFEAQGYGVELLHPIGFNYWKDKYRGIWADPRRIINRVIKGKSVKHLGGWGWSTYTRYADTGWYRIPFDKMVDDNVFLESGKWFIDMFKWAKEFRIYQTTAWGVIQDLTRRLPGYVAQVVPFDTRGTLFFGLPTELYTDTETPDKTEKEAAIRNKIPAAAIQTRPGTKKTPHHNQKNFRDYHYKDSMHHIIANNIQINLDNFYNRIVLKYYGDIEGKTEEEQATERVHTITLAADDTIEEEYWRTKFVFEENCETKNQAFNYALGNLMLCLKEMYSGELIVLGDAKIKPHDIVYIYDSYTNMYGPIAVREVIHSFNRDSGFTTTIVPDLLVHANDPLSLLYTTYASRVTAAMAAAAMQPVKLAEYILTPFTRDPEYPVDYKNRWWAQVYARLGWTAKKREPIGISPLIYAGEPYVAGFEGMKSESWIARAFDRFYKYASSTVEGWNEFKFRLKRGRRRS